LPSPRISGGIGAHAGPATPENESALDERVGLLQIPAESEVD